MGRPEIVVFWVSPFILLAVSSFLYDSVSGVPTSSLRQGDLQNFNDLQPWDSEDDTDSSIENYLKFIMGEAKGLKVDEAHTRNGKEEDPNLYNSLRYFPHGISATPEESVDEKSKVPSPFSFTTSHPTRHRLARPRLNENVFSLKAITKDAQPEETSFDFNRDRKRALSPLDHLVVKQSQLGESTEWKKLVEEKEKTGRLGESVQHTTSLHHFSHKVAGHVKEDATISGVKGHHASIKSLFSSGSFRLRPIPGHTKTMDTSSSRFGLRPLARKSDETNPNIKSHDFKFPYQVPFPYVIRKNNETQSGISGHGQTVSNGVLLQRRNRSRRHALSTETDEATVAERESLVHSQDENNTTESNAESVDHSERIDSEETVKNSQPPPTNPLEALQRLTRLLEKMVRELSQYRQKFTLRLIKMTEREDIDQMQDIMKDFDVSPTKPIFFIAGGIKLPIGTRTESSDLDGNISPPTVPIESNQEISGLAAPAVHIPTTGDPLESTPETTSLPVEPESKTNETGSDLIISRHNINSSEMEPVVENSHSESRSIRHTRSIPELHEFGINLDFFPITSRQARTESPHDEEEEDDDDDDDELDEEEEEYRKTYRPWRDRESQHLMFGVEPSSNSVPSQPIHQSHPKLKDDDATQETITTSISPVNPVSAIPADDSITGKEKHEKINDQDANLEQAVGVDVDIPNFSTSSTTYKPYIECTSTPPPTHTERKGSEEGSNDDTNTHSNSLIGEERAIREPTENLHLDEQSYEKINKEQVSYDKLEMKPVLVSTEVLLNTENGQEIAPGASELLFDKQTFPSLPVTSSHAPLPVTNNGEEAYETLDKTDAALSQNSFNSETVGDKHGIIMMSTGNPILINDSDTILPQSSSTIEEATRPEKIIGKSEFVSESSKPLSKENVLTLDVPEFETQSGVDAKEVTSDETPHSLDVITHQGENNHVGSLAKANSPLSEDAILEKRDAHKIDLPTPKVDMALTSEDPQRTLSLQTASVNNIVGGGDIDNLSETDSKPTSLLGSSNAPFPVKTEGSSVAADKTGEFAASVLGEKGKEEIHDVQETFTLGETQANLVLDESVTTNKVGKNVNERNMEKEEIAMNQPTFVGQTNSEEIQIIGNKTSPFDKTYPTVDFEHQTKIDVDQSLEADASQNDVQNTVLAQSKEFPETSENTDEKNKQESIVQPIMLHESVINVSPLDNVEKKVGNIEEKSSQSVQGMTSQIDVGETQGALITSESEPLADSSISTKKIIGDSTSERGEGVLPEREIVKKSEDSLNFVVFPSLVDKPDRTSGEDLNVVSSQSEKDKRKIESSGINTPNIIPTDNKFSSVSDAQEPVVELEEIPEKVAEKILSDSTVHPVDAFQVVSDVPSESVSAGADSASEEKVISTPYIISDYIPALETKQVDASVIDSQPRIPEIRNVSEDVVSTAEKQVGVEEVKKVELSTAAVIKVPETPQLVNDPTHEATLPTSQPTKIILDVPVTLDVASPIVDAVDVAPKVVPVVDIPAVPEAEKVALVTDESSNVPVSNLPEIAPVSLEAPQDSEIVSQFSTLPEPEIHMPSGDIVAPPYNGIPVLSDFYDVPQEYPVETPEIYNSNSHEVVDSFPSVPIAHPFDIVPSLPTGEDVISSLPQIDPNFGIRPIITHPQLQIPGFRPALPIRPQPEYLAFISQGVDSTELRTPQYPVVIPSPPVLSAYSPGYIAIKREQQLQNFFSGMVFRKETTD